MDRPALKPGLPGPGHGLKREARSPAPARARAEALAAVLATATVVFLLTAVWQGKGWRYHFLPAIACAALLVAVLVAGRGASSAAQRDWSGGAFALALGFVVGVVVGAFRPSPFQARIIQPMLVPHSDLRAAACTLASEEALDLVVLFGSAARADEAPEDLDIAVRGTGPLDLVRLTNRMIQLLGVQEIDLVDLRRADPLVLALVARDGVPLFERTAGAFAVFASLAARRYADTRKFRDAERDAIREFGREIGKKP